MKDYRTKSHPHGKLVTNCEKTIAFVRLPKCGSTTFTKRHALEYWDDFSNHENTYLTFCAIRDPYARFLSSIPETIIRIYNLMQKKSKHFYSDIPISDEIYNYLSNKIRNNGNIVKAFIATIEEYGYFDSHHEPMIRFLFGEKKKLEINPIMISVEEINMLSEFLFSFSGQSLSKIKLENYNINAKNSEHLIRNSLSLLAKRVKSIHSIKQIYFSICSRYYAGKSLSTMKKMSTQPLNAYSYHYPHNYKSWLELKALIYKDIKSEARQFSIKPFIQKFYAEDIKLYSSILKTNQKTNIQNFLSLSKRLDQHTNTFMST